MKLNKKAMMDDLFDFLFTVFAAFFILLFAGVMLSSGVNAKEKLVLEHLDRTQQINDFLVLERGIILEGGRINSEKIDNYIDYIRKHGDPQDLYQDNPWVAGVDSSGDPIPIVG